MPYVFRARCYKADGSFLLRIKKNGTTNKGNEIKSPINAPIPNMPPIEAIAYSPLSMMSVEPSGKVQVISTV